ncbi:hypothetical protein C8Q72DRAFT_44188 [Fomitopsis betulina]|nr:hypothetical protein C8Q72DRAFT_44188 [Fomitopsis betulina]
MEEPPEAHSVQVSFATNFVSNKPEVPSSPQVASHSIRVIAPRLSVPWPPMMAMMGPVLTDENRASRRYQCAASTPSILPTVLPAGLPSVLPSVRSSVLSTISLVRASHTRPVGCRIASIRTHCNTRGRVIARQPTSCERWRSNHGSLHAHCSVRARTAAHWVSPTRNAGLIGPISGRLDEHGRRHPATHPSRSVSLDSSGPDSARRAHIVAAHRVSPSPPPSSSSSSAATAAHGVGVRHVGIAGVVNGIHAVRAVLEGIHGPAWERVPCPGARGECRVEGNVGGATTRKISHGSCVMGIAVDAVVICGVWGDEAHRRWLIR